MTPKEARDQVRRDKAAFLRKIKGLMPAGYSIRYFTCCDGSGAGVWLKAPGAADSAGARMSRQGWAVIEWDDRDGIGEWRDQSPEVRGLSDSILFRLSIWGMLAYQSQGVRQFKEALDQLRGEG